MTKSACDVRQSTWGLPRLVKKQEYSTQAIMPCPRRNVTVAQRVLFPESLINRKSLSATNPRIYSRMIPSISSFLGRNITWRVPNSETGSKKFAVHRWDNEWMSRIKWREVFKFLSGVPFLGYTISPELLGARAVAQFVLFVVFFYFGYLKK
jgi:hypothetical protein